MRHLSISAAWDETRAIFTRDGSLLITVALALIALPSVISGLINPAVTGTAGAMWGDLVSFIASVIAIAGQLALIRLAIGPSTTVGNAIAHGIRRMPIYFLVILMLIVALFLISIPIVFVLGALGVPLNSKSVPVSGPVLVAALFYSALLAYFGVRLLMSSAVASAEDVGPIEIIKRSWHLTSGYWWPLFGFLLAFLIGMIVVVVAINSAAGAVVGLLFGTIQPMSAAALILALIQAVFGAAVTTVFAVMVARIYLQLSRGDAQVSAPRSGI